MKKFFKYYVCGWALLLALFNVIAFVSVGWVGQEKYTVSFWLGYILITGAFLVQLAVAFSVFRSRDSKELFHNVPSLKKSVSMLIASFVFGGAFMLLSPLYGWIVLILFMIIWVAMTLSLLKTMGAVNEVQRVEETVKAQTAFIKSLTTDAETLMARAKSGPVKAECKKVYEAIRYSDPMSNDALASIESEISDKFAALSDAVKADDAEKVAEIATEVIVLVGERNKKCRLLK